MGKGDALMNNEVIKEKLKQDIQKLIEQKGGDLRAYKNIIKIIWEYLRYILGFMTSIMVMERAIHVTNKRFSFIHIDMTENGPDLNSLNNSSQTKDALKFCIDYVIDIMEKLAGDILLKGLLKRLNRKKSDDIT